jgi:aryl-alcohol dehydrogenase-like predicted oxidoreductase
MLPRLSGDNFAHNVKLVDAFKAEAARMNVAPSQLALAWVLSAGDNVVPIPGTKREKYLMENISAGQIVIDDDTKTRLNDLFFPGAVKGSRYPDAGMIGIEE